MLVQVMLSNDTQGNRSKGGGRETHRSNSATLLLLVLLKGLIDRLAVSVSTGEARN